MGGWVLGGWVGQKKTKLMLYSTLIEIEVEISSIIKAFPIKLVCGIFLQMMMLELIQISILSRTLMTRNLVELEQKLDESIVNHT